MAISLRFNESDTKLIKSYASLYGLTVSEFIRNTVLERIEDEHDLNAYDAAMEEYKKDPVSFSHKEVMQMFAEDDDWLIRLPIQKVQLRI